SDSGTNGTVMVRSKGPSWSGAYQRWARPWFASSWAKPHGPSREAQSSRMRVGRGWVPSCRLARIIVGGSWFGRVGARPRPVRGPRDPYTRRPGTRPSSASGDALLGRILIRRTAGRGRGGEHRGDQHHHERYGQCAPQPDGFAEEPEQRRTDEEREVPDGRGQRHPGGGIRAGVPGGRHR